MSDGDALMMGDQGVKRKHESYVSYFISSTRN